VDFPIGFRQSDRDRLIRIEAAFDSLLSKEIAMAKSLDALTTEVTNATTVEASAVILLQGLKKSLDAAIAANAAGDSTQLDALSASLGTSDAALAAAITANTPAAGPTSVGPGASTPAG
jgi:hypothetical protein